jgi:serpin B
MMQAVCWVSIVSLGLLGFLSSPAYSAAAENSSQLDTRLVSANTSFGFKLFEKLLERSTGENIFISPTSIAMALEMTYNGARGGTQKAMAETLELQGMSLEAVNQANTDLTAALESLGDIQLDIANSLWADKRTTFEPDFIKRNKDFYQAALRSLDFGDPVASAAAINKWVDEETRGKIREMVEDSEVGMDVVLFLINAVYFKGSWTVKFDEQYTGERDFTLLDGSKKKVPMMMTKSNRFGRYQGDGFQAVSLPYGDEKVSMYIFLPDRDLSLEEFHKRLSAESWANWMSRFQKEETTVILPRFKLECEANLNKALKELGMGVAFSSRDADFTGMCTGRCWIDKVKHKTFVEVNEEGTEAAAATVVKMKRGGPAPVRVDRPFFCAIRDDTTGAVLFMGCVVEP